MRVAPAVASCLALLASAPVAAQFVAPPRPGEINFYGAVLDYDRARDNCDVAGMNAARMLMEAAIADQMSEVEKWKAAGRPHPDNPGLARDHLEQTLDRYRSSYEEEMGQPPFCTDETHLGQPLQETTLEQPNLGPSPPPPGPLTPTIDPDDAAGQLPNSVQPSAEFLKEFPAPPDPLPVDPSSTPPPNEGGNHTRFNLPDDAIEILAAHNTLRSTVGAPLLLWDFTKAGLSEDWAEHMAETGQFEHSPREGRGSDRENLAMGPAGSTWDLALDLWRSEEADFEPGVFPDVSETGDVNNVLHLTQMIWFGTVAIGCGKADGRGSAWFVCRYGPGGNRDGEWVGKIPITDVRFDEDSGQLTEAGYTALDEAITNFKAIGYSSIDIHGAGQDGAEAGLTADRVEAINDYLISHGVPPDAIASGKIIITNIEATPPVPVQPSAPVIVYFDWDRAEITPQAASQLDQAAEEYRLTGKAAAVLAGHADRSGNASYDSDLARQRAENVRAYLASRGVPTANITTSAFGSSAEGGSSQRIEITFGPGSGW